MDTLPAYKRRIQENRANAIKIFLENMVIPEDFGLDDLEVVEKHLDNAPIKTEAFCEWFGLGDWFYDEMVQDEFDLDEFMVDLRSRIEDDCREATEDYYEKQREHREMVMPHT